MVSITITKEELDICINQLSYRLEYFDKEVEESKDPARIKEIMRYIQPLQTLYGKLLSTYQVNF